MVDLDNLCDEVLEILTAVLQLVFFDFEEAEEEKQHELLALTEKVLQLITIMSPAF